MLVFKLDTTSSPPRRRRSGVTRTMEVSLLSPRVTTHLLDSQKSVRYSRHSNSKDLINLELEYTIVVGHRFSYFFSYLRARSMHREAPRASRSHLANMHPPGKAVWNHRDNGKGRRAGSRPVADYTTTVAISRMNSYTRKLRSLYAYYF